MELIELKRPYPRAWHATFAGGWERIRRSDLGLASTSALLDQYGVAGELRERLELEPRVRTEEIRADGLPPLLVRDQQPLLPVGRLERVLEGGGMSVEEWCRELNRRSFFFALEDPLKRLLSRYATDEHDVLVLDARKLADRYEGAITLSAINTGAIAPAYKKRGVETFCSIADYPIRPSGGPAKPVAEITVSESIRDIEEITIRVERWLGPERVRVIWPDPAASA